MISRGLVLISLSWCVLFAGCGSPADKLVGKWEIDKSKLTESIGGEQQGGMEEAMAKFAAGMVSMMEMTFEFRSDHTCEIRISVMGQTKTEQGTWRFVKADGDVLTVAISKQGQDNAQEGDIKFLDHDTIEMQSPESAAPGGNRRIVLRRVK